MLGGSQRCNAAAWIRWWSTFVGMPIWLLGTVGRCERMIQGLDAAGYYMAGRQAAWVSGSADLVLNADCMLSQSQVPCLPCARVLSDAVHDPCTTRIGCRCRHEVLRTESSELQGPPQSYHEDKRDGFEEYRP